MKKNIFIIIFLSLFWNCSTKPDISFDEIFFNANDINSYEVKSIEISNICDSIIQSNYVLLVNDKLIFNELGPKGIFHAVNVNDDKYIGLFGDKGRGPGEMILPSTLAKEDNSVLQVFDIQQRKVVLFNVDSLPNKNTFIKEFILKKLNGAFAAFVLDEKAYSLNFIKADYRIYISDLEGNAIKGIGMLPDNDNKIPNNVFAEGHPARIQYNDNIIALSYTTTPWIQIFNKQKKLWVTVKGPEHFSSIFDENKAKNNSALAYTKESKVAYTDIRITKKYVYALYSGKSIYDSNFNDDIIYIFDLKGNPIKKLILDKGVLSFDVYKDKYIYGLSFGEKNHLLKFEI